MINERGEVMTFGTHARMWSLGLAAALLLGACGGSDGDDAPEPSPCILIEGTSGALSWETMRGLILRFPLASATDFTAEDYTISYDIFIESTSTDSTILQVRTQQNQDPNSWTPSFFDETGPFEKGTWLPISYAITKANRSNPTDTEVALHDHASLLDYNYQVSDIDLPVAFCIKNVRVTNGTNTPLDLQVTSSTEVSSLGLSFDLQGEAGGATMTLDER